MPGGADARDQMTDSSRSARVRHASDIDVGIQLNTASRRYAREVERYCARDGPPCGPVLRLKARIQSEYGCTKPLLPSGA